MKQFKSRMISNSNLNIIPRSYSSEVLIQQEVRFSDCFLVRSTVSVYKHSFLSARVSSLSQCWTAVANASCTLLAFFAGRLYARGNPVLAAPSLHLHLGHLPLFRLNIRLQICKLNDTTGRSTRLPYSPQL
jgi:hypothetical protein